MTSAAYWPEEFQLHTISEKESLNESYNKSRKRKLNSQTTESQETNSHADRILSSEIINTFINNKRNSGNLYLCFQYTIHRDMPLANGAYRCVLKLPNPWSCSRTSISNSYEQETNNPLEINSHYIETSVSSNNSNIWCLYSLILENITKLIC